jgi:hypothetical protein
MNNSNTNIIEITKSISVNIIFFVDKLDSNGVSKANKQDDINISTTIKLSNLYDLANL